MAEPKTLVRRADLEKFTCLRPTHIKRLIARAEFPKPVRIGPHTVAWLADEIAAWQEERIKASRPQQQERIAASPPVEAVED